MKKTFNTYVIVALKVSLSLEVERQLVRLKLRNCEECKTEFVLNLYFR
jgi:hypothetical protein